jgi:hypothetical protein
MGHLWALLGVLCSCNAPANDAPYLAEPHESQHSAQAALGPGVVVTLATPNPNTLVADGQTSTALTATVTDSAGRLISGMPLTFSSTNANDLFAPVTAVTNCAGQATSFIASSQTGSQALRARRRGPYGQQGVNFTCPGTFLAANMWPATGSVPFSVASADFNGDGKVDLVTADNGSATASIFLGNGNGSFAKPTAFSVAPSPRSVAVGDLNGDSKPDIVVVTQSTNLLSVLLNSGTGSMGAVTNYGTGNGPTLVRLGDMNADGKLDAVTANHNADRLAA